MTTPEHALRFGVQLPTVDGLRTGRFEIADVARAVERVGFDNAWVGDHLSLKAPVVESIVAATTALAVTERIMVGFGVLVTALRQPVWLAKQLSSLQVVARNRLEIGVGVGGEFPQEWHAAGVPVTERGRRTDALLDALPQLLGGQAIHLGPPWDIDVPALEPTGAWPTVWIGGRSDIALRRAVRTRSGWLGVWVDAERVDAARNRLGELAAATGVPCPPIAVQVLVNAKEDETAARAEMRSYIEGIYDVPFDRLERYTASGSVDAIAKKLAAMVIAGATTVVLMPGSPRPLEDVDAFRRIAESVRGLVARAHDRRHADEADVAL